MCYTINESSTYKKDLKKNKKAIPGLERSISTVVSQLKRIVLILSTRDTS